ncbi:unnamed protein product, partial [Prunus brigantina]
LFALQLFKFHHFQLKTKTKKNNGGFLQARSLWNSVEFRFFGNRSASFSFPLSPSLTLALYCIHGRPEIAIELVELGSGEEEDWWIEDEAGGKRIMPWKLGAGNVRSPALIS